MHGGVVHHEDGVALLAQCACKGGRILLAGNSSNLYNERPVSGTGCRRLYFDFRFSFYFWDSLCIQRGGGFHNSRISGLCLWGLRRSRLSAVRRGWLGAAIILLHGVVKRHIGLRLGCSLLVRCRRRLFRLGCYYGRGLRNARVPDQRGRKRGVKGRLVVHGLLTGGGFAQRIADGEKNSAYRNKHEKQAPRV